MKVGILTYHWVANFGANLQALSTYKCIENTGNIPIIINWIPEDVECKYEKIVLRNQIQAHNKFAANNFKNISRICRNSVDVANVIDELEIDLVLIGSDAVFTNVPKLAQFHLCRRGLVHVKPASDTNFPNPFWGDFLNHTKKQVLVRAVSASAQNMHYKKICFPGERSAYSSAIRRFDKLFVRDVWTQNMVSFITKGEIVPSVTPDPVFAFEQNVHPQPINYIQRIFPDVEKYVLFSAWDTIKDNSWITDLENLFGSKGIAVIGLPKTTMKSMKSPLKRNLHFPIDPLEWYDSIKLSSGYIGELMHPVLVSLHNAVPVYSFDTYGYSMFGKLDKTSSKIYQILKRFEFLDNYYNRKLNKKIPTPQTVFESILRFDANSCKKESSRMLNDYNNMMSEIIKI